MSNPLRAQIHPTAAGTIGLGGLIAGVLDITDAIVFYYFRGVPASRSCSPSPAASSAPMRFTAAAGQPFAGCCTS